MEEEATASGGGVMAWTVRGNVPSLGKPSSWAGDSGFRLEVWVLVAWPVDGMRQYFRTNANRLAEGGPNTPLGMRNPASYAGLAAQCNQLINTRR